MPPRLCENDNRPLHLCQRGYRNLSIPNSDHAILAEGLEKSYREWPVLWDLDLSVSWGESLSLFGANGAGKTTLLRILATGVRPDAGVVRIAGHDLRRHTALARRCVGVVAHRSFLYDDLTPRENLNYYARLYGIPDRDAGIGAALERVGLSSRANHRVRTLSNGMQRRAAIARAILHQPDVLLLDEPETGLDQDSRQMLGDLLAEWTAGGRSVVLTTHDIELGIEWGHRAAVLSAGKLSFTEGDAEAIQAALSGAGPLHGRQQSHIPVGRRETHGGDRDP